MQLSFILGYVIIRAETNIQIVWVFAQPCWYSNTKIVFGYTIIIFSALFLAYFATNFQTLRYFGN